jgi:hypothetical protein
MTDHDGPPRERLGRFGWSAEDEIVIEPDDGRIEVAVRALVDTIATVLRGGPGSGHRGHAGIPGHRGGSLPGDNAGKEKEPKPPRAPRAPRTPKPKPTPTPVPPPKPKLEVPTFAPRPKPTTPPAFKRMDVKYASSRKLLSRIAEDYARALLANKVTNFKGYMALNDESPKWTAWKLMRGNASYQNDISRAMEANIGHAPSQEEFETLLGNYMDKAAQSPYDRMKVEIETAFEQANYEPKENRTMADLMVTPDSERWNPVRAGFDAVDQVHVLPDLTPRILKPTDELGVPVVETRSGTKFGHYRGIRDQAVNMAFNLSHPSAHPEMTVGHETGHMIDHIVFGVGSAEATTIYRSAGTESMTETSLMQALGEKATPEVVSRMMDFGAVMDSIRDTPSYETLRNFPPGTSTVTKEDGSEGSVYVSRGFVRYVSTNSEAFARAYSQYITVRSGNENMHTQLGKFQQEARDGEIPLQWQDDEFKPVATAFDKLFRNQGWLK